MEPEGDEIERRQQIPDAPLFSPRVHPAQSQPDHGGNDGDADGVDLLVHRGLVPYGEGRRREENRDARPHQRDPRPAGECSSSPIFLTRSLAGKPEEAPENPMGHEEVETGGHGAGGSRQEVQADSHG